LRLLRLTWAVIAPALLRAARLLLSVTRVPRQKRSAPPLAHGALRATRAFTDSGKPVDSFCHPGRWGGSRTCQNAPRGLRSHGGQSWSTRTSASTPATIWRAARCIMHRQYGRRCCEADRKGAAPRAEGAAFGPGNWLQRGSSAGRLLRMLSTSSDRPTSLRTQPCM
jgi:hypothetical protein